MPEFRVVDLKTKEMVPQSKVVRARTPEAAARQVLGVRLVRSGQPKRIRARVYFQEEGKATTMVRLYDKKEDDVMGTGLNEADDVSGEPGR